MVDDRYKLYRYEVSKQSGKSDPAWVYYMIKDVWGVIPEFGGYYHTREEAHEAGKAHIRRIREEHEGANSPVLVSQETNLEFA